MTTTFVDIRAERKRLDPVALVFGQASIDHMLAASDAACLRGDLKPAPLPPVDLVDGTEAPKVDFFAKHNHLGDRN